MISTKFRILLISSSAEKNNFLKQILKDRGFFVFEALNGDEGIKKAVESTPDLIICQNEMQECNGFQLYNHLKSKLIKNCVPFFIYSDEFDQEDILIGLEMGIDNFIISPVDEAALVSKIEHQIKKIKEIKQNEMDMFRVHFDSTPVAKFIMKNRKIDTPNNAFLRLMQLSSETFTSPSFEEVFNISENKKNLMDFRKCINGCIKQCNLNSVPCFFQDGSCFDIYIYSADPNTEAKFFAEVYPSFINAGNDFFEDSIDYTGNSLLKRIGQKELGSIKLTAREKQIFQLSSLGLPVKQIAAKLKLSERTVEKHRANIMQKTNTNSIIEAIHIFNKNNGSKLLNVV